MDPSLHGHHCPNRLPNPKFGNPKQIAPEYHRHSSAILIDHDVTRVIAFGGQINRYYLRHDHWIFSSCFCWCCSNCSAVLFSKVQFWWNKSWICPEGPHGCHRLNLRAALSHGVRLGSSEAWGFYRVDLTLSWWTRWTQWGATIFIHRVVTWSNTLDWLILVVGFEASGKENREIVQKKKTEDISSKVLYTIFEEDNLTLLRYHDQETSQSGSSEHCSKSETYICHIVRLWQTTET